MPKSEVRIDKWLWAVRVFKTRTVASEACKKGRVMIGDTVAKPARTVKVGDVVKVRQPPVTYSFKVLALTENRLGARLVPEYMENVTPKSELDLLDVVRISGFIDRRKGLGRPTKGGGTCHRPRSSVSPDCYGLNINNSADVKKRRHIP